MGQEGGQPEVCATSREKRIRQRLPDPSRLDGFIDSTQTYGNILFARKYSNARRALKSAKRAREYVHGDLKCVRGFRRSPERETICDI